MDKRRFSENSYQHCLTASLFIIFIVSVLLSIASRFGQYSWQLDVLSHFQPWYLLIQAVLCLLLMGLRDWKLAGIVLLGLGINALPFISFFSDSRGVGGSMSNRFKLLQFNVCAPAKDYAPLSHYLSEEKPDIVTLEECGDNCFQNLKRDQVFKVYPYQIRKVPYRHRLLVLSKFPIQELKTPRLVADPAVLLLRVQFNSKPVTLLVMHSTRPSSGKIYYERQIQQFHQIAKLASATSTPFLMAGDLNVSPWNYSFSRLLEESHLKNSMDGFGFQPSFPIFVSRFKMFPLVPIDHVLVSQKFQVLHRHIGPRLQSDHLPLIVELGF